MTKVYIGIVLYFLMALVTGVLSGISWRHEFDEDPSPTYVGAAALIWPIALPLLAFGCWGMLLLGLIKKREK